MRDTWCRLFVCSGALLAAGTLSAAERGQIGFGLGYPGGFLSYQATERLSLRPTLGLGRSSINGWHFDLGATALYHTRPGRTFSPYVGVGFAYHHRDPYHYGPIVLGSTIIEPHPGTPTDWSRRNVTAHALVGLELTVSRRFSLFGELSGRYQSGRFYEFEQDQFRRASPWSLHPKLGLTFKLR